MFDKAYLKIRQLAGDRRAPAYLYGLTFCESSFFPIPTDIMLAPMSAVSPHRALRFAWWTTVFSVLGAVFGYLIGYFLFYLIEDWLSPEWKMHYRDAHELFDEWGAAALFIAAVSPFPFKIATIAAGSLEQNLIVFIVASFAGRALRFYAVALLSAYLGPPALTVIEKRINLWGWVISVITVVAIFAYILLR